MSAMSSIRSAIRSIRGAAACAAAVESGRRPTRRDLEAAGIDPETFGRIRGL